MTMGRRWTATLVGAAALVAAAAASVLAGDGGGGAGASEAARAATGPARGEAAGWPTAWEVWQTLTLQRYNTRLVVLSTAMLGLAAGLIGSFLLLRKRSLMGDVLSHATLPGIGLAFIGLVMVGRTDLVEGWASYFASEAWSARLASGEAGWAGVMHWLGVDRWPAEVADGKWLPGLLVGATLAGAAGFGLVLLIRSTSRLKDDAAMGIVLSVFFGIGIAALGMVQNWGRGSPAGLESFIYGKTASMAMSDFLLISLAAGLTAAACVLLFKEFALLCFDEAFASAQGWPTHKLDVSMLVLVTAVTVVGLQAVGLILIIALLITPAAAARFWTHRLPRMMVIAGLIGAASGWLGASMSALIPNLAAGAIIVLTAASLFVASMIAGPARGVVARLRRRAKLNRRVGRQHLLRAAFELLEPDHAESRRASTFRNDPVSFRALLERRSWTAGRLRDLIRQADREDHVEWFDGERLLLSEAGFGEAARVTRNHRLWEMFLVTHADIAPSHVDRDADMVEHVLGPQMVRQLEQALRRRADPLAVPASPHDLDAPAPPTGAS